MDPAYEALAAALLGGAGGGFAQAGGAALWDRLRVKLARDPEAAKALAQQRPDDEHAVRTLTAALEREADADPTLREQLVAWNLSRPESTTVNTVSHSQGVNIPGGAVVTINSTIHSGPGEAGV